MPIPRTPLSRALGCALAAVAVIHCRGGARPAEPPAPASADTAASGARTVAPELPVARIEELIEGRAPGVQVIRRPDGGISLRVRGTSSPAGNNEPLVIVDGMSLQPSQVGAALSALHPRDVLRIDVLKDAASTAFYGMRGANGVIVITTRRR